MKNRHRVSQAVSKLIIDMGDIFAADGHRGRRKSPAGVHRPSCSPKMRRGGSRRTLLNSPTCCDE
jgi:hypothetical protein